MQQQSDDASDRLLYPNTPPQWASDPSYVMVLSEMTSYCNHAWKRRRAALHQKGVTTICRQKERTTKSLLPLRALLAPVALYTAVCMIGTTPGLAARECTCLHFKRSVLYTVKQVGTDMGFRSLLVSIVTQQSEGMTSLLTCCRFHLSESLKALDIESTAM